MEELKRTHSCGELTAKDAGETALLMGWVSRRRDHGHVIFVDVRDREGITQVVFDAEHNPEAQQAAKDLRTEFVIAVQGNVRIRAGAKNPNLDTGEIELAAEKLWILSEAKTTPFVIEDDTNVLPTAVSLPHPGRFW